MVTETDKLPASRFMAGTDDHQSTATLMGWLSLHPLHPKLGRQGDAFYLGGHGFANLWVSTL